MIKLTKNNSPEILIENGEQWQNDLMKYVNSDEKIPENIKNKYNHEEIKNALRNETKGKCMYCESPISHITYEHIEHIKPKAKNKYPELSFTWDNLGLACPICNMNKGDQYDENIPFINPYADDPSDFFFPLGPFIYHKIGNKRGEITERLIKLNRSDLFERRKERIENLRILLDLYANEKNLILRSALFFEIEKELEADRPYLMVSKALVDALINETS